MSEKMNGGMTVRTATIKRIWLKNSEVARILAEHFQLKGRAHMQFGNFESFLEVQLDDDPGGFPPEEEVTT